MRFSRCCRGFGFHWSFRRWWSPRDSSCTESTATSVPKSAQSYADSNLESPKPFNPKQISYEVFGPPGTVADISYFDVNSDPKRVDGAPLPWALNITTIKAAMMGNLVAQGNSDSIGCRIVVDGDVKAEKMSNEVHAFTFCLVKSA